MAVDSAQIIFYLTPSGNSDPLLSLGGAGQGSVISEDIHELFDIVQPEEAVAGDVEYRAIDIKNTHPTETVYSPYVWIDTETVSTDTVIDLAYDSAGVQSVPDESTAPSSPTLTFTHPTGKAGGISLGDMVAGSTRRIWLRRTITALATKMAEDYGQLILGGATYDV